MNLICRSRVLQQAPPTHTHIQHTQWIEATCVPMCAMEAVGREQWATPLAPRVAWPAPRQSSPGGPGSGEHTSQPWPRGSAARTKKQRRASAGPAQAEEGPRGPFMHPWECTIISKVQASSLKKKKFVNFPGLLPCLFFQFNLNTIFPK